VYRLPDLAPGERAECTRCGTELGARSRLDAPSWLALALGAFITFLIANTQPVVSMTMQGITQQPTLLEAVILTWQQGKFLVALVTGLLLLQLLTLIWVLMPLVLGRRPLGFAAATRMVGALRPWSMVPVFVLAAVVAVVKLADMASVRPGVGLPVFAALGVMLTLLNQLKPARLWHLVEQANLTPPVDTQTLSRTPALGQTRLGACLSCGQVQPVALLQACCCRRCGAGLRWRRPEPLVRTSALLLAAAIVYFPANLYPVMRTSTLAERTDHTILSGIAALWHSGAWDIALIVFVASVMVPAAKLLSLALLVFWAQRREPDRTRERTRLYWVIERIGQWSMLDVYVIVLLTALADFPGWVQVSAQAGAAFFGLVVILTMCAAMSYDPRVIWDVEPVEPRNGS